MVLRVIFSVFVWIGLCAFSHGDSDLLKQYEKKISKDLKKTFNVDKKAELDYQRLKHNYKGGELYRISNTNGQMGFLFLKEVKACTLNGCLGNDKLNDNIESEYFDVAITVSLDHQIQSIRVLDYFSDYGYEITSKRYLKRYKGKSVCDFKIENPAVDGISGATVSYNGLIGSIDEICQSLN